MGKRFSDTMRLGKREPAEELDLVKRYADAMRFGKRMDQMRLGKRNFNSFMQDDSLMHSISNGKRMGDVMRLGKRSGGATELSLSDAERDELMRNLDDQESDEDFFEIKKKMSD